MEDVTLVVLCAGNSTRFENVCKKQWLRVENEPLWLNVTSRLNSYSNFKKTIVVSHEDELRYMQNFNDDFLYVKGGETRQNSIKNALNFVDTKYVMISDVARACISKDMIDRILELKDKATCVVPVLGVSDTVIYEKNTINRDEVKLIQTPQLSLTDVLKKALDTNIEFTDESSAIKNSGYEISYVKGCVKAKKLTFLDDLDEIPCLKSPSKNFFTGFGFDLHSFEDNKPMFLGGVELPYSYGFKAHSDGDVLIHSLIDALLGAIGAGDIGEFFPDTDERFKNIDSKKLLEYIVRFVKNVGYEIVNVDITIIAEQPKINPHKIEIKNSLSQLLNLPKQFINVKATTSEKIGSIGRKEGVVVQCVANVKYYEWDKK
ncbi:bifunctional 2-C-methyl-D-erythritol 4-phosphate cytidylyltransferase/2-C-methyl-D-erythritol 2,4-cyclodiphosphate synthase [Aliarcobacter skirrowii]|uniref:bifunctional 2-C-methyl-D-erythritol 4-phosphate cytidylyltransferase/2-C-methyl-D-erythritol 2,4-cyclodiphosphate synthase n=1 Tax=Aliarcobacter skirrowii TaxID=28200 RepID=UPI00082C6247|nr:bifunctional 2-C-methyl-D-erythritol 4-phosphate cytidylyltransferase/2-C-methyl-D-erythritol 2,4-cyclodiphosphate synthase [Aliarcobacter skirrowii]MDD3025314.1 bifunctional 2-C-methyl-D-erythritol 4-phosphate cytidylyltransferase/2-C-methyl-D-erythritol 2,4-cyclodiphosphate synthase [Aliarcobacter skirrowii]MDX4025955.1 bifunctional 2-C-methyl-D-erythritol 4-phosphate cytidylyltransferase/2-C-methyl-D-erythritol 2,4-cyclodiphosphate synthase [Aliarcobacter skirrowii]MDX4064964.1 bifunctiona